MRVRSCLVKLAKNGLTPGAPRKVRRVAVLKRVPPNPRARRQSPVSERRSRVVSLSCPRYCCAPSEAAWYGAAWYGAAGVGDPGGGEWPEPEGVTAGRSAGPADCGRGADPPSGSPG